MRLKQLLSAGLAVPLFAAVASADSQLTGVNVQSKAGATTVTIHANGALTHNEYRPVENLLLVDFPGATIGTLDSNAHSVSVPGVTSYQVHSYKAANGSDIARVELTLDAHASVQLTNEDNGVVIAVNAAGSGSAVSTAATIPARPAAAVFQTASLSSPAKSAIGGSIIQVRGISVVRGHDGTEVEIRASGLLSPKTLTLTSPDRLVIDLPNAVPDSRPHDIPVHAADLNMVRMAQYRSDPPTTRVVLDLKAPHEFLLASAEDKLIVKLRPAAMPASKSAPANGTALARVEKPELGLSHSTIPASIAAAKAATETANASTARPVAQDYVVLQPEYHVVSASKDAPSQKSASEKAADAAKVDRAAPAVEIPVSAMPAAAAMKPEALKSAMMQAATQGSTSAA
ncbi:MAG: AMIN domain-containing protein, partial [Acidobacteria bacterium]|nr:AMIN domain-containing protein [Acidobacteriota bacterium]